MKDPRSNFALSQSLSHIAKEIGQRFTEHSDFTAN